MSFADQSNIPPCARAIFIVTRGGYHVEPLALASSWRRAEWRRIDLGGASREIAAFNIGLTSGEKLDLARRGIPTVDLPEPLPPLRGDGLTHAVII